MLNTTFRLLELKTITANYVEDVLLFAVFKTT